MINIVGMSVLMAFMLFITYKDILRLFLLYVITIILIKIEGEL